MHPPAPAVPAPPTTRALVRLVRAMTAGAAAMTWLLPAWFWSDPARVRDLSAEMLRLPPDALNLADGTLWQGWLAGLPLTLLVAYTLWQLWCLFGLYGQGRALERPALVRLRRFAWGLLATAVAQPLSSGAMSAVLTLHNPPGQRLLKLSLGWDDYLQVLLAAVLLAIAQVMHQAVLLAEENRGFV